MAVGSKLLLVLVLSTLLPVSTVWAFTADTWCRYDYGHWRIISDLPALQVPALMQQLEQTAEVFDRLTSQALPPTAPRSPARERRALDVWAFRTRSDFRRALGDTHFSGFAQPSLTRSRLLIGPQGVGSGGLHANARHEMTHFLQRSRINWALLPYQEEGQANVLGGLDYPDGGGRARLRPPPAALDDRAPMSVRALARVRDFHGWRRERLRTFYWSSQWSVYAQLLRMRREQDSLIGAWDVSAVHEAARVRPRSSVPALSLDVPAIAPRPPETSVCFTPLQRNLALAESLLTINADASRRLLETTSEDARDGRWHTLYSALLLRSGELDAALAGARVAVAMAAADAGAKIQLGDALVARCWFERGEGCDARWAEAEDLYRNALLLDPERVDAIFGLGVARLYSGRSGDGLNYLRIAAQRAPWSAQVNFFLGEAYRLIGNPKARVHLQRAARWARQDLWRIAAEEGLAALDR